MTARSRTVLLSLCLLVAASHFVKAQDLGSYDRFVPMGHSYDTSNRQLPTLNSYEDRINNQADRYETEIYRQRKERAQWEHQLNSTHGTHLGFEPQWPAGY